jgi:hypothetical protein
VRTPKSDVGALRRPGGGDRLAVRAAPEDEGQPGGEHVRVVAVLEVGEQRGAAQRLEPGPQVRHPVGAAAQAQVRHRPDERPGRPQLTALDQPGPEHQGRGELLGDQQGGARVDGAVGPPRRVVELAEPGVPGAGVVLRGRALAPGLVQPLDDEDPLVRLGVGEQHAERRAHHATAHQHGIPALDRPGSAHGAHAREPARCLSKTGPA